MKKVKKMIKDYLLPIIVVISLLILPALVAVMSQILYSIGGFYRRLYDVVDYDSIKTTMISISFTTLGFAITLRNILIGRDREKYFGFSVKTVIQYSTTIYCKICWYTILCVPFIDIMLYVLGYRRQLVFFTVLSVFCMIVYFVSVLKRIQKEVYNETIAYMMVENLLSPKKVYTEDFREEIFQKLFCDIDRFSEVNVVFDKFLNFLYKAACYPKFLLKRTGTMTWTIIQQTIRENYETMSKDTFITSIKSVSLYSFNYFDFLSEKYEIKFKVNILLDEFSLFIDNTTISVVDLAKSEIYQHCLNESAHQQEEGTELLSKNNAYFLLFNYLLGLLCAGAYHLSLDDYKKLVNGISRICVEKTVLLTGSIISALSLMSMYYLEQADFFSLEEYKHQDIFDYCTSLAKETTEYEYRILEAYLFDNFSIYNSPVRFKDAYQVRKKEFQYGYGVFLNALGDMR